MSMLDVRLECFSMPMKTPIMARITVILTLCSWK